MNLPSIDTREFVWQYCIAVLLCGAVLLFLYSTPAGKKSLLLPDGSNKHHPWNGGDTMTYIEPAKAFLHTGTFARGGKPDMHRTIGYPLFLAITMQCFGQYWLPAAYICQIFVFALIFPASSYIAVFLFPPLNKKDGRLIFLLLAASGVGLAYTGQIMTDQFFASLLTAGLACGLVAVLKQSWKIAALHILLVGYAAQVRPTLGLFFLADCFVLLYTLRVWKQQITRKRAAILVFSVFLLAIAGSGPSFRNYFNHGVFIQTDVLSDNFSRYLAGAILRKKGISKEYNNVNKSKLLYSKEEVGNKIKFAFSIAKRFPIETIRRISYHIIWNSFETHWESLVYVYNEYFFINKSFLTKIKENMSYIVIFYLYYIFIYFLFFAEILKKIRSKDIFFLLFIFIYIAPLAASFISGAGARMRIYTEPVILMVFLRFLRNPLT